MIERVAIFILCLIFAQPALAESKMQQKLIEATAFLKADDCIKELKQIYLVVDPAPISLFSKWRSDELQTQIETKFRTAGLRVVDGSEGSWNGHMAIFRCTLIQGEPTSRETPYGIAIELAEPVALVREHQTSTCAVYWHTTGVYCSDYATLEKSDVHSQALLLVDQFLNEWMKANGR